MILPSPPTVRRRRTEAVESSGVFDGLTFFASESAPIGNYEVHTCVGVPTKALDPLPRA